MRYLGRTGIFVAVLLVAIVLLPERAPVVSAITGEGVPGVSLRLPTGYLLMAPLSSPMDYMTVLAPGRHLLLVALLLGSWMTWRGIRMARRAPRGFLGTAGAEVGALLVFLAGLVAYYAYGVLGPRPMARLAVDDPDVVVIDFHSHTESSHDGRRGFTVDRNLAWHRAGGFDVVYITDHDSIRAGLDAVARNPDRAGAGLVAFTGREVVFRHEHVVALGLEDPRREGGNTGEPTPLDRCRGLPLLIQTLPEDLSRVPGATCPDGSGGVDAIELVDGDPRGLEQGARERARVLAIADSLGLAVVASSNLHGWGRTAAGWSLMRIPGWRRMTPEQLSARIESDIRRRGTDAVLPLVRRSAFAAPRLAVPTAAVLLPLDALTLLSRTERIAWILWGCLAFLMAWKRRGPGRPAVDGAGSDR